MSVHNLTQPNIHYQELYSGKSEATPAYKHNFIHLLVSESSASSGLWAAAIVDTWAVQGEERRVEQVLQLVSKMSQDF